MTIHRCPCHTCQPRAINALDDVIPRSRLEPSPAETLIYERQPGETCSCARLNAREGASLRYACSRCPPPSISEAQRAAWEPHRAGALVTPGDPLGLIDCSACGRRHRNGQNCPPCVAVASGWRDCRDRNAATGRTDECGKCSQPTPAAMLGEALEQIRKARRIVAEMEGRALTPQVAADLGVATLKGREMAEHVERSLRAIGDEKANP